MARENKTRRDEKRFGKPERLADVIASRGITQPSIVLGQPEAWPVWEAMRDRVLNTVADSVVIQAQNVMNYCDDHYGGAEIDYRRDIPNYMPPFNPMIVEFARGEVRHGMVIQCFEGDGFPPLPEALHDFRGLLGEGWSHVVLAEHAFGLGDDSCPCAPSSTWMIPIDLRGQLVGEVLANVAFSSILPEPIFRRVVDFGSSSFFPAFLAVSLMHCKNVSMTAVAPNPKLNRERKAAGKKPFVRYHTINIEPMKSVLRSEGGVETNGLPRALHICRGHFATYSEDRPLFGRVAGTVWRPSHVRGSVKAGVVVSDYNVKGPEPKP